MNLFVTGTDTGVGKTVVTAAICATTGATPMKPIQTGGMRAADVEFILRATETVADLDLCCPYRFAEPLAPAVAARRAGVAIDLRTIGTCFARLAARGAVVVEGAGGILVEVSDGIAMADLAAALHLPVVVVCRPGLGTLNHAALTVEATRARGLEVLGLVISGYPSAPGLAERTNPAELARVAPILGVLPTIEGLDVDTGSPGGLAAAAHAALAPVLGGTFDARAFLAAAARRAESER